MSTPFKISKILIANRGEIALRVQRACRKLGIATVSVASEADRNSLHARSADELVIIGPPQPTASYLNIAKLVEVGRTHGCDGVHPGYGFLSENAQFARAVVEAGMIFIGPDAQSIETLGSKTAARAAVQRRGVPCTPGSAGDLSDRELEVAAHEIGLPVIIKAVAGGGGRGMRIARSMEELREALPRARAEAMKNFASDQVYVERYIERPRHVEVQIFGDHHGSIVHLGTRDCSTQRRHQKLVEEAPAPALSPQLRERIHAAAVEAARSVGYRNAGTAEFLVSGDDFYFLEMNTRIQVEHPVTEMVTGLDLVELQIRVARGEPLPFTQEEVSCTGHAIEFRIYAESPTRGFTPTKGLVTRFEYPKERWIRDENAYEQGDEVSLYYDAMLSKLIVVGNDRRDAIEKSRHFLRAVELAGLETTLPFHRWLLELSPFRRAPLDIGYLEREFTPRDIEALEASEVRDEHHQMPVGGACVVETLEIRSPEQGGVFLIEVVHEAQGTFLARPGAGCRIPASPRNCRRSNGRLTAIRSFVEEVLTAPIPQDDKPL